MKKYLCLFLFILGISIHADNYVGSVAAYNDPVLSVTNTTIVLPAAISTTNVKIQTNMQLSAGSKPYWLTVTFPDANTMQLTNRKYTGKASRKGTLTLKGKDNKAITINIIQLGSNSELYVDKESVTFYGDRLTDSILVSSNIDYTVECPDWITQEKKEDGTILLTATKLYDAYSQTDPIYIKDSEGNILKTITATKQYYDAEWFEKPYFGCISDIHIGDTSYGQTHELRFPRVLNTLNSHEPKIPQVVIIGDLADHAKTAEYVKVKNYLSQLNPSIEPFLIRGNHDNITTTGLADFQTYLHPEENRYEVVRGYPFIGISDDNSAYRGEKYYAETLAFLKNALEDASTRFPDKPIFVFTHVLAANTIKGSYSLESGDLEATGDSLDEIFSQYPQIININGHTHHAIQYPNQIYQKNYTTLNDGSQKRDGYAGYYHVGYDEEIDKDAITEGLFIHIDKDDQVIIERWNTARNLKYEQDWVIAPPFDGTNFTYANRNGGKAPWWASGAKVEVSNIGDSCCTITFPQAIDDNEGIQCYRIYVRNETNENLITPFNQCSLQYMGATRPDHISIPLSGLPVDIPIKILVYARDYYDLYSTVLQTTVTIPKQ